MVYPDTVSYTHLDVYKRQDWERTLVPQAAIGDYAVFVRQDRSSEDWYLGAVTDRCV